MQLQIDLNEKESVVSLDRIIDMVLENAEAGEQASQFDYMKAHEQKFMAEIKKYSCDIWNPELDKSSGKQLEETVENKSSGLHDAMSEACIAYFRHGMKLGAELILELLH